MFAAALTAAPARADVMRVSFNDNLCLDLNQSTNKVALWTCNGGANQQFVTRTYGQQKFGNLCMEGDNKGGDIYFTGCANKQSQRWGLQTTPSGLLVLKNETGYCADIPGGDAKQGQRMEMWDCNNGANQSWKMGPFASAAPPPAPAPVASGNQGVCQDAWINQAMREVLNRAPNGSGTAGECNPGNYGQGQWSSYRDLLNKVTVKMTGKGVGYVFIAPKMAVLQGHVGWAYMNDNGSYSIGATDAGLSGMQIFGQNIPNLGVIGKGHDTNQPWREVVWTEAEVLQKFKGHYATDTYNEYKVTFTASRNVAAANAKSEALRDVGYGLYDNNCVDHTYQVLQAYGVNVGSVMRPLESRPAPNSWFRAFGTMALNGSVQQATNTPGAPL